MKILIPLLLGLLISAILGFLLALANKYFAVKEDNRIEEVTKLLPGANCGGCGYAGCKGFAEALVSLKVDNVSNCKVSKPENKQKIVDYLKNTPDEKGNTINIKQ